MSEKLTIDISGIPGLSSKYFGDVNDSQGIGPTGRPWMRYIGQKGAMVQGYWNPFRNFGYMSPPTSMAKSSLPITEADVTYNFDSEMRAGLYDVEGSTGINGVGVFLCDIDNVWCQNGGSNSFVMRNLIHLSSNSPRIMDMECYEINGVKQFFVSYQQTAGTHGDIATIQADTSSDNLTWFSGTASGGGTYLGPTSNLALIRDDKLYILDANSVHSIDGSLATGGVSGTVAENIFVTSDSEYFSDAVGYQGNLWIVGQSSTTSQSGSNVSYSETRVGVYSWNKQLGTSSVVQYVPITGMREVMKIYVTPSGDLRIIGISNEMTCHIRQYNGTSFEIIQEIETGGYPPYRKSLSYLYGMTIWMGANGKVYAHGKLPAIESTTMSTSDYYQADALYILGDMNTLPNTQFVPGIIVPYGVGSGGMIGGVNGGIMGSQGIIFNYSDANGNKKVWQWMINGTGTISGVSQLGDVGSPITLVQRLEGLSRVNYIRVWHAPVGNGGVNTMGTLSVFKNQSSTALPSGTVAITQMDIQRGYKFIPIGDKSTSTFAIQFEMSWQTSAALSDSADWMPYMIEVDYDPLPKLK